jgi:hypothetical protein
MRTLLIVSILLCSFCGKVSAQAITASYILGDTPDRIAAYKPQKTEGSVYKISFHFGESIILNPAVLRALEKEEVIMIDFIYTKFRETSEFDQRKLNTERIEALRAKAAFLFRNTAIVWNVVEQSEAPTKEENEKLFHGFYVYARPYVTIVDGKLTALDKKPKKSSEVAFLTKELKHMDCYHTERVMKTRTKKHKPEWTGYYIPKDAKKDYYGVRYDKAGLWGRRKEYKRETYVDTFWVDVRIPDTTGECVAEKLRLAKERMAAFTLSTVSMVSLDTVVTTVLNRNKKWKDMVIVQDVTGSMYPYTMQTLTWRRLNQKTTKARSYVFFNDGDSHPDGPIGNSGGAYDIMASSGDKVENICTTTMSKGGGGAGPENNIEALIYAQNKYPDAAEFVMIADNWAPVRDMALLRQIKVPVHIIVCGAYTGQINIDYLNIALETGGTVHTIEEDFNELFKLKEGEVIKIGVQKYKVQDKRFILTR